MDNRTAALMDNRTAAHIDPASPDYLAYLVVGNDPGMTFLGRKSYEAWACPAHHVDELLRYVDGRKDMKRVRCVSAKGYKGPRKGHLSVYVASPDQLGMELLFRPPSGVFEVFAKGCDLYLWSTKDSAFRAQSRRPFGQYWRWSGRWSERWPQVVREWASGDRAWAPELATFFTWGAWWTENKTQVLADLSTEAARLTEEAKRLYGQV